MAAPSQIIKLGHARDHLRQHFAIDAGLESMDHRPLGSDPNAVDPKTREWCREQMQRCRDNAHWEIAGMIGGSKITVWKERSDGGLEPAGSRWAQDQFDAPGVASDSLYFDRVEWEALLQKITSVDSRAYFQTNAISAEADPNAGNERGIEFDYPQSEWVELWQGPLIFRATFDKGQFGPGHTIDRMNQYAADSATGGGRHQPIYSVRINPSDGAIEIAWLVGHPGQEPPYQTSRYFDGWPGRAHHERLRTDAEYRDRYLSHLPLEVRLMACGAYATAITLFEWAVQEFYQANHQGQCEIWARIGSKVGPFRRIPPDVFRAYTIRSWGHGQPGAAWAELEGAASMFAIHVAPAKAGDVTKTAGLRGLSRAPAVKVGRPPSDEEILAKADEMKARGIDGRTIAKTMRLEPGFQNVATTTVRDLIKGRWRPGGRPKKAA